MFLILVFGGVLLWRRISRERTPPPDVPDERQAAATMIQCSVCGVYLPQEESIKVGDRYYCSDAHRPTVG